MQLLRRTDAAGLVRRFSGRNGAGRISAGCDDAIKLKSNGNSSISYPHAMKHCPKCRTTYTDDGLRYCLADGTELSGGSEPETVVSRRGSGVLVDVATADSGPRGVIPPTTTPQASPWGKIIAVIAALGLLLILV